MFHLSWEYSEMGEMTKFAYLRSNQPDPSAQGFAKLTRDLQARKGRESPPTSRVIISSKRGSAVECVLYCIVL